MNFNLGGFVPLKAKFAQGHGEPLVPSYFRKALKELGGTCDDGVNPRIRIVWGGSEMHFAMGRTRIKYLRSSQRVPVAWEVMDNGERKLLPLSAAHNPDDKRVGRVIKDWLDVGQPFFFLEEWCPPEVACDGWELQRWGKHPDTGEREDVMGERPSNGLYTYLLCLKTDEGKYMPPNEATLEWVRKMLWIREHDLHLASWSWRDRPPSRVVEGVLRERYYDMYRAEAAEEEEHYERWYSMLKPLTKTLTHEHPNEGGGGLIIL